jgi:hypothetical protein
MAKVVHLTEEQIEILKPQVLAFIEAQQALNKFIQFSFGAGAVLNPMDWSVELPEPPKPTPRKKK